jgi:hypothetical protein
MLHCFDGCGVSFLIRWFDVEIGSDFIDVGGSCTRIIVKPQHFQCATAINVLRDVFGYGSGDTAYKYEIAQPLCAFKKSEHTSSVLRRVRMLFYKNDLICAWSVYFLQRFLWYFSFQYRVGGLLRRRHEITISRIFRKSGIYQTSCKDLVFSIDFSGIQFFIG